MLKNLIKLANHLDSKGLVKEADYLDKIISIAGVELPNPMSFENFQELEKEEDFSGYEEDFRSGPPSIVGTVTNPVEMDFSQELAEERSSVDSFMKSNGFFEPREGREALSSMIGKKDVEDEALIQSLSSFLKLAEKETGCRPNVVEFVEYTKSAKRDIYALLECITENESGNESTRYYMTSAPKEELMDKWLDHERFLPRGRPAIMTFGHD